MNAQTARSLRRETKRTLGHKLQEFAEHERQTLHRLEGEHAHLEERFNHHCANGIETNKLQRQYVDGEISKTRDRIDRVLDRRFFGRLKWLLFGQ